jgi:hypothetical protein
MSTDQHGLMLDPSFILSKEGLTWLEGEGAADVHSFAVSARFYQALRLGEPDALEWFARSAKPPQAGAVLELLGPVRRFSYMHVDLVDARVRAVHSRLASRATDPVAEILRDEWAFMQTQSWLGAKSRQTFEAFAAAGARIKPVPRQLVRQFVRRTLKKEHLPPRIPLEMLMRTGLKWIGVGGSAATALVTPPLAIAIGFTTSAFLLLDP